MRLRLDIAYRGSAFAGWAVQPGQRTVAGVLGEALATVSRTVVPMVVAGRTDAGVHATGQVAHIDLPDEVLATLIPRDFGSLAGQDTADGAITGLRRRLAGLLPDDVRVWAVSVAPAGFDARFSALRRHYRYRILCSDWGLPPLGRGDLLHHRRRLDAEAMQRAAEPLVGLHDFAAYCKPREGATTIRELQQLGVTSQVREQDGALAVQVDVAADAFCHSMVRSLVGALLAVGDGRRGISRPAELLAARQRTAEIAVAPARGLTLMRVDYPPDADLAGRAEQTRALRTGDSRCDCAE